MYSETFIDDKLMNLELTTLKDYSVQGTISSELFEEFAQRYGTRDIKTFKTALIEHLREEL